MGIQHFQREQVTFHRNSELRGVEVRSVAASSQPFACYSTEVEFLVPGTWCGEMVHRSLLAVLGPGQLLCARPGDVFSATKVRMPGSRTSLLLEPEVFEDLLDEHCPTERERRLGIHRLVAQSRPSCVLRAALERVFSAFCSSGTLLELEGELTAFVAAAAHELLEHPCENGTPGTRVTKAVERIKERLEQDPAIVPDFRSLARDVGLSRFQALRAFKHRFGLTPHSYHLRVRLGLAQRALRTGARLADVAADYGFVDQSHLTRHFQRQLGINPGKYARLGKSACVGPGRLRVKCG